MEFRFPRYLPLFGSTRIGPCALTDIPASPKTMISGATIFDIWASIDCHILYQNSETEKMDRNNQKGLELPIQVVDINYLRAVARRSVG